MSDRPCGALASEVAFSSAARTELRKWLSADQVDLLAQRLQGAPDRLEALSEEQGLEVDRQQLAAMDAAARRLAELLTVDSGFTGAAIAKTFYSAAKPRSYRAFGSTLAQLAECCTVQLESLAAVTKERQRRIDAEGLTRTKRPLFLVDDVHQVACAAQLPDGQRISLSDSPSGQFFGICSVVFGALGLGSPAQAIAEYMKRTKAARLRPLKATPFRRK